jgi:hypothetical protein
MDLFFAGVFVGFLVGYMTCALFSINTLADHSPHRAKLSTDDDTSSDEQAAALIDGNAVDLIG